MVVGTEAVLQRIDRADAVAFLDLDQELLAPRYRAAEQALALVARAARVVAASGAGERSSGGPPPPADAVARARGGAGGGHADVQPVAEAERARRELLRFPPYSAMAEVSGAGRARVRRAPSAARPASRWWRPATAAGGCERRTTTPCATRWPQVDRPAGRLRIEVDPLRI